MISLGQPFSKLEIVEAWVVEVTAVHNHFAAIEPHTFFASPPGVWSPAENLVHLIKSCAPVVMVLNIPKTFLRIRFGWAKHDSRPLAQVRYTYLNDALANGGQAGGPFVPEVREDFSAAHQTRILAKWQEKGDALHAALQKWDEKALDNYLLPHPLLGKLTVREILFFTLYHNLHHVNDVQRLLDQPEMEWFA
ncbi:DinB family protein [Candidatus Leptofilum sp.]|uniref:DinB family protein n=1 Tax=Candidatus Leptofilum sp. TaxID=3241576 RepID=UPI003B5AE302